MFASPLSNIVYDNTKYIFGMGRTGTSLLYKILHSCNMVMADYEPPVMQSCLGIMDVSDDRKDCVKTIFKTYLGEEFFINYLLARKINKNANEFSAISDVKDDDFISILKSKYNNRSDVEAATKDWTVLVKIPNLNRSVEKLISPKSKIVLTRRILMKFYLQRY